MRKSFLGIKIVMVLSLLASCGKGRAVHESMRSDSTAAVPEEIVSSEYDFTEDAEAWADSIMAGMTLEEMAGQLIMPAVYADDSRQAMRILTAYAADLHVGGVLLLKGTLAASRAVSDSLRSLLRVPPFIAIDAEWGLAMRLEDTPGFPRNGRISGKAEETLLYDYGAEVASEARKAGINMVLGPVLDVLPASGRGSAGIGSRSFGRDAKRTAALGTAYAKGLESGGVLSVAKHFPGHGSADADSHRRLPRVAKNREELDTTDLLPFREYINSGLSCIMTGHLDVPSLGDPGVPVTVSEKIQKRILREELGFRGLILTDAMNMAGAEGRPGMDALMSGADIILAPADTRREVELLAASVRNGTFMADDFRDRVRRVLFFKYKASHDGGEGSGILFPEAERIRRSLEGN